jgi:hypothetical protein
LMGEYLQGVLIFKKYKTLPIVLWVISNLQSK